MDKANTNRSKKEVCGGSGEAKPTGKKRKNVNEQKRECKRRYDGFQSCNRA
ncbi:hypothetical protein AtEden1_Chr5g0125951 [Arabidopsis thaliana]